MSRSAETPPPSSSDRASSKGPAPSIMDDWDQLFDADAEPEPMPELDLDPEEEAPLAQRYLGFRLSDEFYGVPILELSEVVKSREVTYVPRVRPFIRGIISVRGTIVPIVDLRRRLAFASEDDQDTGSTGARRVSDRERVLITRQGGESFGLLVDEVTHPFSLEPSEVEAPPPTLPRRLVEFVQGIGRVEERIHILLDLDVVLRFDAVASGRLRPEVSP